MDGVLKESGFQGHAIEFETVKQSKLRYFGPTAKKSTRVKAIIEGRIPDPEQVKDCRC